MAQHGDSSDPYDVQSVQEESFTPQGIPNTQNSTEVDINQPNHENLSAETNENGADSGYKRKLTSDVWHQFERKSINEKDKAICMGCKGIFVGGGRNGTTHLREHLREHLKFSILAWWSANSGKYPILSRVAKDILAVPISTVSSESAFSVGGKVVSPQRSRLHPSTVEALMCLQSWLFMQFKDATKENPLALNTILEDEDVDVQPQGESQDCRLQI